jgi:transcriptional regulator with PAS, ATPase and Fis domain
MESTWLKTLPVAITVTDNSGKIIEMNDKSAEVFSKYGGYDLIGKELNNCHNPHSQVVIACLLSENKTNAYTIEKNGLKKLIFQSPWYQDGKPAGLVEISVELPEYLPHFIR